MRRIWSVPPTLGGDVVSVSKGALDDELEEAVDDAGCASSRSAVGLGLGPSNHLTLFS